ncbi:MAG TPA: protein-export chaperone SecB [Stellaceae bacterium]
MSDTAASDQTGQQGNQLVINAQYIKDLSFENPRAPQSLIQQNKQPEVSLNVDVKARNLGPDLFEVMLSVSANAQTDNEPVFIVELSYGAVVTARAPQQPDILPLLVLVEAPRMMFPFVRNIIADATREGGFPPLLINPIDFVELLRRQQQQAEAAGIAPNGGGEFQA